MSNPAKDFTVSSLIVLFLILAMSCGKDDDSGPKQDDLTGIEFSASVLSYATADTIGNATFKEHVSGAVTIEVSLSTISSFSAALTSESGVEGGQLLLELSPPDGATGNSSTYLSQATPGTYMSYDSVTVLDGHISILDDGGNKLGFSDLGPNALTETKTVYQLSPVFDPLLSGSATLYKLKSGAALVAVRMQNLNFSANHPSHIHNNTAIQSGSVLVGLTNVKGSTGVALTHVEKRNDGSDILYDDLIVFNGYIAVHKSEQEISTLVGQGDIGKNALTGREREYALNPISNPNISGTVLFQERKDYTTLATISLQGTVSGKTHPAHIHENTAAESGAIIIEFNNVVGGSGKSFTNLSKYASGVNLTYDDLLNVNGYVNVHFSPTDFSTLIAQTDIGQNALTGEEVVYDIIEINGSGISGQFSVFERENGFSLGVVQLAGSLVENSYSAGLYGGDSAANSPEQLLVLRSIGAGGLAKNAIKSTRDGKAFTYNMLITSDAHLRILKNSLDLSSSVAIVNIGSNANARTIRVLQTADGKRPERKD